MSDRPWYLRDTDPGDEAAAAPVEPLRDGDGLAAAEELPRVEAPADHGARVDAVRQSHPAPEPVPPPPVVWSTRSTAALHRPGLRRALIVGACAVAVLVVTVVLLHPPSSAKPAAAVGSPSAHASTPARASSAASTMLKTTSGPGVGRSGMTALLLDNSELTDGAVTIERTATPRWLSLAAYAKGYRGTTEPAECAVARGMLLFTDTDKGTPAWSRPVVVSSHDLAVEGSVVGTEQVRQFDTEEAAAAFVERQRSWFDSCSSVRFHWEGAARAIDYRGHVIDDVSGTRLTELGHVEGSSSGLSEEFDGWVREGRTVAAFYLLGDGTSSQALQEAGGRIADAFTAKLRESAQ